MITNTLPNQYMVGVKCPGCNTQWFINNYQLQTMITTTNWLTCTCHNYKLTINSSGELEFIRFVNVQLVED